MACAVRQKAIKWVNIDPVLCRQMASPGHNELINCVYGTPYVMGGTYVPRFWPPFFTLAGSSTIFLGYFSHPPTAKLSFGVQKLPIFFTKIDLFGPKFNFFLDLFGSNFQRPAAHPHQFSGRDPPPRVAGVLFAAGLTGIARAPAPCPIPGLIKNRQVDMTKIKSLLQKGQTSLYPGHEWLAIVVRWFHLNVFISLCTFKKRQHR